MQSCDNYSFLKNNRLENLDQIHYRKLLNVILNFCTQRRRGAGRSSNCHTKTRIVLYHIAKKKKASEEEYSKTEYEKEKGEEE
jgi:hypothetical protein